MHRYLPTAVPWANKKCGVGEHEGEGAGLTHEEHIDAGRTKRGQDKNDHRDQDFSHDGGGAEPKGNGADHHDRDDGRRHQDPIGRRVQDLPDRRNLVVAPSHEAVDPVGGPNGIEQAGGRNVVVQPKQKPEKNRDAEQSHQGDEVGCRQDAVKALFVVGHGLGHIGRPV